MLTMHLIMNLFSFSSTMKDGPECPEIYKHPNPRKYIWPLRNYEIYRWDGTTATTANKCSRL